MMNRFKTFALLLALASQTVLAQRVTDPLDRGVVAVKVNSGVFVSWRVQADEYYDVTYNLYRDGSRIATGLQVSNYSDPSGSTASQYQVAAVRKGIEQEKSAATGTWAKQYLEIPVSNVQARSGVTVWKQNDPASAMANYTINDISLGDVDGDGKIDFIVKRKNQTDQDNLFPTNNYQMYCQIEAYASSVNYGRLWWIDCGPNICYGADEQWDAVAFDWNEDGACEVLYRGGANTVIHHSDGTTETIGNVNENIRGGITHTANMTFSNSGEEWLMYIDGRTGKTFDVISYPLPRGNASDWGDGYGHRSSKYFMGAPYFDGVNPYIFLGRGIYTKIDACSYRVDKQTNKLYAVGATWHSYTNQGWHGQGYHNFTIADVDEDGRDEVVYGSMVLDFHDGTGRIHGMSSSNLGHGDASHTGDLDPYRKGLETFACNEDNPAYNYRNAATCEIYARGVSGSDDGRAMAANISNEYPGALGASTTSGILPLSYRQPAPYSPEYINGISNNWNANTPSPMALNFRIYWDGDLLDETINGPGSNESYLFVDKLGGRIFDTGHGNYETACINGTKKNPCASGDILGDWREEIVMRSADNRFIRVYTTVTPTSYRMPSLWYDHQYRQSMVWQTEGYNQPPHTSYFVGELEGLTQAPPPLTTASRTIISNNGTISPAHNGKDVMISSVGSKSETTTTVTLAEGAVPSTIFLNAPHTIEGNDQVTFRASRDNWDRIRLNGAALSGTTNISKQGGSAAHLPNQSHTHTGRTDVWQGALICNGDLRNSPLWGNIHTELFVGTARTAAAAEFKSIEMEYGSTLYLNLSKNVPLPGDVDYAHIHTGSLILKEGARVVLDIKGAWNADGDRINTDKLYVRKRDWQYGPQYSAPIFQIRSLVTLTEGDYELGTFGRMYEGKLKDVVIEMEKGSNNTVQQLFVREGKLYLHIGNERVEDESEPTELVNGDYYLQNVATGQFLIGGANWCTRAVLGEGGINFTVAKLSNGKYTLDSHISNNQTTHYLTSATEPYVDGAAGELTLTYIDDHVYCIGNGEGLLTAPEEGILLKYEGDNLELDRSQWRFLTRQQVIDQMDGASPLAPAVATTLIDDPNFGRNDGQRYASWTWSNDCTNKNNNGANENWCVESFHSTFTFSQTLTGLPNGTYLLRAQGFYRQDGSDNDHLPMLFANQSQTALPLKTGNEGSMAAAGTSFLNGDYEIAPVAVKVTDGTLTIGVRNSNNSLWVIWDNFRLYYLGDNDLSQGDVDGNGDIDIADLTQWISIKNGGADTRFWTLKALHTEDVNGDGQTNNDDLNAIVNQLKNKE